MNLTPLDPPQLQNKEQRAAQCRAWRKSLGLADDETRCYGGFLKTTRQDFKLVDAPICPNTGKPAARTTCECHVCVTYAKYYESVTNEKLLPLLIRDNKQKKCIKCQLYKSYKQFYRDRQKRDGYRSSCKLCLERGRRENKRRRTRKHTN